MDSRNLMLGDFVKYTEFGKNEIDIVECVEERRVLLKHGETYTPLEYIEPLPLTPEILKKNGFVLDDEWYIYTGQGINIEVAFRDDNKFVYDLSILTDSGSMDIHAKYVHELQRALRFLKTNKDIVL